MGIRGGMGYPRVGGWVGAMTEAQGHRVVEGYLGRSAAIYVVCSGRDRG